MHNPHRLHALVGDPDAVLFLFQIAEGDVHYVLFEYRVDVIEGGRFHRTQVDSLDIPPIHLVEHRICPKAEFRIDNVRVAVQVVHFSIFELRRLFK